MISLRFYRGRSAFLWSSLRTSQTAASSSWLPTRTSRYFRTQRVLRVEESKVQGGDDVHKPFSEVEEDKKQSNDDSQKPAPVSFRGIPYFMFFIFVGNAYFIGKDAGFREKSDAQQTFEHHPILPFTFKEANKKLQAGEDSENGAQKMITFSNRVASNFPVEDKYSHEVFHVESPSGPRKRFEAWGVFDGHA